MAEIHRKWAHSGGYLSRCAYTPDGSSLYTIGGDLFVRSFNGDPAANHDEAAVANEYHEQPVLAIDSSMESLVTGGEDGQVALFTHGSQDLNKLLTRSSLGCAIRSVKFSPNGQRVAVASDELIGKVVDVRDTSKMQVLEGHTKGIRAVTWSPDGQLVTSSSSDGTIRVWDVSNPAEQEPNCIQVLEDLIGNEEADSCAQCEAVWHPSGKYFVVGTKSHEIAVVTKASWEREGAYEQDGHTGEITALAFSANGRYLCSAAKDGAVLVWDTTSRKPILRQTAEDTINSIVWRPGAGSNSISFIEDSGYVSRWDDVIPSHLAHPNDAPQAGSKAAAAAVEHNRHAAKESKKASKEKSAINFEDDDDDDLDLLDLGGGAGKRALGDEDDDDDAGRDPMDEDDFIEDDEDDAGYRSRRRDSEDIVLPPALGKQTRSNGVVTVGSSSSSSLVRGQEPFQPGATPLKDKRRYLSFNMTGVIHIVERDSHNIVNIDFHDQSRHSAHHFDDYTKFGLAALGPQGAIYAANSSTSGNVLSFRPFETWNSSGGDWTINLPASESVTALAIGGGSSSGIPAEDDLLDGERLDEIAGSGTVVAATSRGFLRFFGASGTQKYIMNFGEQIVAMSASAEWLLIVHRPHDLIKPGHQELSYTIMDLDSFETLQKGSVPLPKGSTLAWIGFSEEQMPYMYDSNGFLSALERSRRPGQARWVPMLETASMARREGKTESYWPVGISNTDFVCIILKGGEQYPYFPVPITQNLPLAIPLLEPADPKSLIEISLLQAMVLGGHARDSMPPSSSASSRTPECQALKGKIAAYDVEMDKSILKLLQLACKAERQQQALDLARTLSTTVGLHGAIKIANLYSLSGLVTRFETLLAVREGTYGSSSWRENIARREGKYSHLVDNRAVPDSSIQLGAVHSSHQTNGNSLSKPFEAAAPRVRQKKTAKNVFSAMPEKKAPEPSQSQVSDFQYDDGANEEGDDSLAPIDENEESMQLDDGAQTYESLQRSRREISEDAPVVVSKPRNPFAKSAQPPKASSSSSVPAASARAGPSNPFAKSTSTHSAGLKKTGSFFNRVDASNGIDTNGATASASTSGPKQSTLFGSKPKPVAEKEKKPSNKGKKRKSDAGADEEDNVNVISVQKKPKNLSSFWKKDNAASTSKNQSKRVESPAEVAEDTQVATQESSPAPEPAAAGDEAEAEPSLDENNSNESAEVENSEPVTPFAENGETETATLAESEDGASPAKNDGMSKLAAFKAGMGSKDKSVVAELPAEESTDA